MITRRSSIACLAFVGATLILSPSVHADDQLETGEKAERNTWTKYYIERLKDYNFHPKEDRKDILQVTPKAMLRWDNPVRVGRTHGELFVWKQNGRGVLVGNVFSYDIGDVQRRVAHEFHSFHDESLVCDHARGSSFELDGPGVTYREIPGAPTPAKTRPLRMAQMRSMAKQFRAASKNNDVEQPLRPLAQPLFRFETKKPDDDGAIFAYVTGTDPELLVTIVSRRVGDELKWMFGAGRFSDLPLKLDHKRQTVWSFEDRASYTGGYYARHGIATEPRVPNTEVE